MSNKTESNDGQRKWSNILLTSCRKLACKPSTHNHHHHRCQASAAVAHATIQVDWSCTWVSA